MLSGEFNDGRGDVKDAFNNEINNNTLYVDGRCSL